MRKIFSCNFRREVVCHVWLNKNLIKVEILFNKSFCWAHSPVEMPCQQLPENILEFSYFSPQLNILLTLFFIPDASSLPIKHLVFFISVHIQFLATTACVIIICWCRSKIGKNYKLQNFPLAHLPALVFQRVIAFVSIKDFPRVLQYCFGVFLSSNSAKLIASKHIGKFFSGTFTLPIVSTTVRTADSCSSELQPQFPPHRTTFLKTRDSAFQ